MEASQTTELVAQTGNAKDAPLVTIERVVALLTPVFAGAAGWLFTVLTKAIPNINIPHDQFVTVFVAGAVLATTASLTWLFGRQKFTHTKQVTTALSSDVRKIVEEAAPNLPNLRQIQAALEAHEASIIAGVSQASGGASATDVAKEIVGQLWPEQPQTEQPTVEQATVEAPTPAQ